MLALGHLKARWLLVRVTFRLDFKCAPFRAMTSVASSTSIGSHGSQTYAQAYKALLHKYRPNKSSLSSSNLGRSFDRHFMEKNITVVKNLASGPNSVVFLGTQENSGRQFVLKVILKRIVEQVGGSVIKRALDYSKIHGDSGGSIAMVHEFASISESSFSLVTDYYPKGSLATLLAANGPLQESVARGMFQAALQGLLHLHKHKMAHRNLKLENMLLDQHNRPVLSDFSFSLITEDSANSEAVFGVSLPYLAPEVLSKVPYDPIIADIWSFGICLYIALNDCLPFGANGKPLGPMESSCMLKPAVEMSLSDAVKKCLKAMMQSDVNKRASTFALDRDAWFKK